MSEVISAIQNLIEAVVFGNGWVVLIGVLLVVGLAVAVRLTGGIRV